MSNESVEVDALKYIDMLSILTRLVQWHMSEYSYDCMSYDKVSWIMFEMSSDSFVYYFKYCVASH